MSAIINNGQSYAHTQVEPKKSFIKRLRKKINWGLELMGTIAIPLVIFVTIVLGMEITTPDILFKVLVIGSFHLGQLIDDLANGLMSVALEACMFGCIGLSRQAKADDDEKALVLFDRVGGTFALLSIVTIGFKIFHVPAQYDEYLSFVRIASVIFYAFKCHPEDKEEEDKEEIETQKNIHYLIEELEKKREYLMEELRKEREQHKADLEKERIQHKADLEKERNQNRMEIDAKIQKMIAEKVPSMTVQIAQNFASQNQENFSNQDKKNVIKTSENLSVPQQFFKISEEKTTDPAIKNENIFLSGSDKKREYLDEKNVPETPRNYIAAPTFSRSQVEHDTDGEVIAVGINSFTQDASVMTPEQEYTNTPKLPTGQAEPFIDTAKEGWKLYQAKLQTDRNRASEQSTPETQPRITKPLVKPSCSQINTDTTKDNTEDGASTKKGYTEEDLMHHLSISALWPNPNKRAKAIKAAIASGALKVKSDGSIREFAISTWLKNAGSSK